MVTTKIYPLSKLESLSNFLVFETTSQFDNKVFIVEGINITKHKAKIVSDKMLELFRDRIDPKMITPENIDITVNWIKDRLCAYTECKYNTDYIYGKHDITCRNNNSTRHYPVDKLVFIG